MTELDVVIVAYGPVDLLTTCLASLHEHPPQEGMRVIVVDNGPGDAAARHVRARFPDVDVVESGGNIGFAAAANAGLARGSSPYALVLNPDTAVRANTLNRMLEIMALHPDVGIAGCRLERPDGSFDHAARRAFPTPLGAVAHLVGMRAASGPLAQYRAPGVESGPVDAVNGAFMLIRRSALEVTGGFDDGYWMYMEDLDLCYRFAEAGWLTWYEPSVTALHLKGATASRSRSPRLTVAFYRSIARFVRAHPEVVRPAALRPLAYGAIAVLGTVATLRAGFGKITAPGPPNSSRKGVAVGGETVLNRLGLRLRPPHDR